MKKRTVFISVFFLFSMILGCKNGYLALWTGEDPQPQRIFPLRISSLPPADQIQLHRGIFLEGEQALAAVLEDLL